MADDDAPPEVPATPSGMLRDGESIVFKDPDAVAADAEAGQDPEAAAATTADVDDGADAGVDLDERPEQFDVHYTCLRCGTDVSNEELGRLPEIKCICGYKVFVKVRPPIVKTIRAV